MNANPSNLANRSNLSNDKLWDSIIARDRSCDGVFVYGVSSTRIFCRPSCPSRRPRRDRVTFFATPAEAERAGYRPCRRCEPLRAADPWTDKITRACVCLANVNRRLPLVTLAHRLGGSPYHLQRNFKRLVGITPREFAEACQVQKVKVGLRSAARVTDAMLDAGYLSSGRFYERAAPKLGMLPSTYRRGGVGAAIRYAVLDSPLGRILVAATASGVCSIRMADSDRELERGLEREFPRARLARDDRAISRWTRQVLAHLEGRRPSLALPLDVRATAFQWQVWHALSRIPFGETRSYGEVAVAIGRPRAARAVARACATNPVALAIPCHRVVPAAGGIGGYRWGVERKRRLVATESAPRRR